jgi:hypothetical protein
VVLSACGPRIPSDDELRSDLSAMTFTRHPNGLCFGVVTFMTYMGYRGVSITHVPESACATNAQRR